MTMMVFRVSALKENGTLVSSNFEENDDDDYEYEFDEEDDIVFQEEEPACEKCWLKFNSFWEADSVTKDGKFVAVLTSVNVPKKLEPKVNDCSICGDVTVVGLYLPVMTDPPDIENFPRGERS